MLGSPTVAMFLGHAERGAIADLAAVIDQLTQDVESLKREVKNGKP